MTVGVGKQILRDENLYNNFPISEVTVLIVSRRKK